MDSCETNRDHVVRDLRYLKSYGKVSNNQTIYEIAESALELLKEQETVKPKTGHWFKIHGGTAAQCTICKCWGQINMKFCPWCGAKMET